MSSPKTTLGMEILLVTFHVHQDVAIVVRVKVFHLPAIERGGLNVVRRAHPFVQDGALGHIPHLELHFGSKVTRGIVIRAGDNAQLTVDDDRLTATNFTGSH